jgi:hypothetical protein
MIRIEKQRIEDLMDMVRSYQIKTDDDLWRLCELIRAELKKFDDEARAVLARIEAADTEIACEMEPIGRNHDPDKYRQLAGQSKQELIAYIKILNRGYEDAKS